MSILVNQGRLDDYDENGRRGNKLGEKLKEAHQTDDYKENVPPARTMMNRLSEDENPEIILHPIESPIKAEPGVAQDSFDAIVDRFMANDGRNDISIGLVFFHFFQY